MPLSTSSVIISILADLFFLRSASFLPLKEGHLGTILKGDLSTLSVLLLDFSSILTPRSPARLIVFLSSFSLSIPSTSLELLADQPRERRVLQERF